MVTIDQYKEIIEKYNSGEHTIYLDLAGFRSFFTETNSSDIKKNVGNFLKFETFFIRLVMFFLEPLSLVFSIISSIFVFNWFSFLVIPFILFSWFILKGKFSKGRQTIFFSVLLVVIGMLISFYYNNIVFWLKIFIISLSFLWLFTKLVYYLSFYFAFRLIRKNYIFFNFFYSNNMIWIK
ncbi:hypothetical protein M0Q39_03850 [Patescibacteria group bacterium]|nr:hypothetical protein [Patescibacteria group bacterium]